MPGVEGKDGVHECGWTLGLSDRMEALRMLSQAADSSQEFDVVSFPARGGEKDKKKVHGIGVRRPERDRRIGAGHHEERLR